MNLSLSAVCNCGISWSYSLTFFYVSAVYSVKQICLEKGVTKLYELCHESVIMPCLNRAVGVIVAVPGRTHLLFKLTSSIQFLKVVLQEQQNFL